jgi:hypothetical protein
VAAGGLVAAFCGLFLLQDPLFFWHDDYQSYFLPGYREVARSLGEGEFPLLSSFSWQGGNLAGEFQYGIFSVWLLACCLGAFALDLSLPLTAATLSILHLAVMGCGGYRLARLKGLSPAQGLLVAVVSSLNGWVFLWGSMTWFAGLASLAWLPWVWWGMERALARHGTRCRFLPAGVFIYLAITAGWPFTVLMMGVLTVWLGLRSWRPGRGWGRLWPLAAAWGVGLGLSGPAWLMLMEYSGHSTRGQIPLLQPNREWTVPVAGLPGLIFPPLVTHWPVFSFGWRPHMGAELAGGLVPLAVLGAGLGRMGRSLAYRLRWELGLAGFVLLLAILPSFGAFRWSFRWLPLFFLAIALAGARALALLDRLRHSPRNLREMRGGASNPGLWASAAVLVVWVRALVLDLDPTLYTFRHGLLLLGCCASWAWAERRWPSRSSVRTAFPVLVTLAALGLTYAGRTLFLTIPTWGIAEDHSQANRLDTGTRYLSVHTYADIFAEGGRGIGTDLYPGSTSLLAGYELVNGYSPVGPLGLTKLFGFELHGVMKPEACWRVLSRETGRGGLLELMAVDGLVLSHRFDSYLPLLKERGWEVVASRQGATILRRLGAPSPRVRAVERFEPGVDPQDTLNRLTHRKAGPVPLILEANGPGAQGPYSGLGRPDLSVVRQSRDSVWLDVRNCSAYQQALVVFSRPWFPGYTASLNGRPLAVHRLDLVLPAVLLPPGADGRLVLEYSPRSFVYGRALCSATLLLVAGLLIAGAWRSFFRAPPAPELSAPAARISGTGLVKPELAADPGKVQL